MKNQSFNLILDRCFNSKISKEISLLLFTILKCFFFIDEQTFYKTKFLFSDWIKVQSSFDF